MVDWTAWSAIATVGAILVAFGVGVLPVLSHMFNGRARAKVVGKLYLAQLDLNTFWVAAGYQLAGIAPNDADHYNASIGFALNCLRVDSSVVMAELEHLPKGVGERIAAFEVKRMQFERTVCGPDGEAMVAPEDFSQVPNAKGEIKPVLETARQLQLAMHSWLFPKEIPPTLEESLPIVNRVHEQLIGASKQSG